MHRTRMQIKGKRLNDLLLVGAILILAVVLFAVFLLTMSDGDKVTVSVNGESEYVYSLSEDVETTIITGADKEQTNVLVIKDGKAFVKSASCPDKICVGHRAISKDGETIVCLPHKVVISIESTDSK